MATMFVHKDAVLVQFEV